MEASADEDPYRSEPKAHYLIAYTMTMRGGLSGRMPSPEIVYMNAVIEGSPADWLIAETRVAIKSYEDQLASLRKMRPRFPSYLCPPPLDPPRLIGAWPITADQFEQLRPIMWYGKAGA